MWALLGVVADALLTCLSVFVGKQQNPGPSLSPATLKCRMFVEKTEWMGQAVSATTGSQCISCGYLDFRLWED